MIDAIDVIGDAATVRATVGAYVDAGVDVPVLMPLPWGPDRWDVLEATIRAAAGQHLGVDGFLKHAGPPPRATRSITTAAPMQHARSRGARSRAARRRTGW